jgi:hypothetical protein
VREDSPFKGSPLKTEPEEDMFESGPFDRLDTVQYESAGEDDAPVIRQRPLPGLTMDLE